MNGTFNVIVTIFIAISFFILLSTYLSDETDINMIQGNIVEISSSLNHEKISVRMNCKNPQCEIRSFYVKNNEGKSDLISRAIYLQTFNEKVMVFYKKTFLNFIDRMEPLSG